MARKGESYSTVASLKRKKGSGSPGKNTPVYATYRPEGTPYSGNNNSGDLKANVNMIGKIKLK